MSISKKYLTVTFRDWENVSNNLFSLKLVEEFWCFDKSNCLTTA